MKSTTWMVTPQVVARLMRGSSGMPAPDGPDFDPRGPIGPIAYELYRRLSSRLDAVALNPQPIPPSSDIARLIAQDFVSRLALQNSIEAGMAKAGSVLRGGSISAQISDFEDWCGTGRVLQLIEKLRGKIGGVWPKEPPPRPEELDHAVFMLTIGAELYAARDLVDGLDQAGARLMEQGLKKLG